MMDILEEVLPTVDDTELDLDDDLADVMAALEPVAARWRDIGIMFRLKAGDLDTIGASHPGNPSDCMFDVDVYWLEQRYNVGRFGPPTWRKIVEAIWKSAGGGNPDHAWKIAQAHSSTKPALLAETDKLDVMVTDEHLLLISQRMTNWQSIAPFLGLTEAEEEEIMTERKVVQRIQVLRRWRERCGGRATYRRLVEVFYKCERLDICEYVAGLLNLPKPNHQELHHPPEVKPRHPSEAIFTNHQVEDTELSIVDEAPVQKALYPMENKWRSIGLTLGVKAKYLDEVSAAFQGDPRKCLEAVVNAWLRGEYMSENSDPPSWRKIVWALADSAGADNPRYAAYIATDYKVLQRPSEETEPFFPSAESILKAYPEVTQETQELIIDDLQFVIKALHTMSPYWKGIGISLQVEGLDEIRKRFRNDPLKCLIGVVDKWLKDPRGSSWRKLVSVVADKVGGANRQTATYIARHYRELWRFNPGKIATTVDSRPLVNQDTDDAAIEALVAEMASLLFRVVARWYEIGVLLGVKVRILNDILSDTTLDQKERLREVLKSWLDRMNFKGEKSWRVLADAVEHPAGGNNPAEAMKIAEKHPTITVLVATPLPSNPVFDERPTLQQLRLLRWKSGGKMEEIRIIDEICSQWRELAIALGFPSSEIDTIEEGSLRKPFLCTYGLLQVWFQKSQTASWKELITALNKAGFHDLASRLIDAVPNKY